MVALVATAAPQVALAQLVANITCLSSFGWVHRFFSYLKVASSDGMIG
jgi:hypothetical protein